MQSKKKGNHPLIGVHNEIFNEHGSRMCIDDIEDLFKNNNITMDGLEMSNYYEIEKQYDLLNEMMKGKNKKSLGNVQIIRMKIEMLKINTFVNMANDYISKNHSITIFVNFTETLKELSKKLNTTCTIHGQQTKEERAKNIKNFCTDNSRIIICNIQSGGSGISLHDTNGTYPRVSLISPTWSAQDLMQVLGRIHRACGKTDVIQRIIFCKNTIEENIGNIIKDKITNIQALNNGDKKLKKDNMEEIINKEYKVIEKKKEEDEKIYKTNDFEKIQNLLDELYKKKDFYSAEIKNPCNIHNIDEFEYRLQKVIKEIELNELLLIECLNLIGK